MTLDLAMDSMIWHQMHEQQKQQIGYCQNQFCATEDITKKVKSLQNGRIFIHNISDKGLIYRIYKKLLKQ